MSKKTCFKCLLPKDRDDFYDHLMMRDGKLGKCKDCCKADMRKHREVNDSVRERERQRYREGKKSATFARYRAKLDPEAFRLRRKVYGQVSHAIKMGKLIRPSTCSQCGRDAYCEAAHTDYSKPLEVRWLCRRCHRRWDSAEPKTA